MKTLMMISILMVSAIATASKYHDTMVKNIDQLEKTQTVNGANQVAATFLRIADVEKSEWLPRYYAAYAYIYSTHFLHDADSIDVALDKAQVLLDDLLKSNPNESEVYVLQSFVYSLRITSMSRGMKYSGLSNSSLDKAEQLNPKNPRVYYCRGNNVFHTPSMFGGGAEKAQPLFEKAKALFETNKSDNDLNPSWGQYHNALMLEKCKAEK